VQGYTNCGLGCGLEIFPCNQDDQPFPEFEPLLVFVDNFRFARDSGAKRRRVELVRSSMSTLAIVRQPRKRSVVQISESRPGHFASIRRLPN
jgi:hypothetical protein